MDRERHMAFFSVFILGLFEYLWVFEYWQENRPENRVGPVRCGEYRDPTEFVRLYHKPLQNPLRMEGALPGSLITFRESEATFGLFINIKPL